MRFKNVLGQVLLFGFVAAAAFSCSSSDDSTGGGAGSGGKAGAGSGGKGGSAGKGGAAESAAGEAGMPSGGSAVSGGTGGATGGSAGKGGTGGASVAGGAGKAGAPDIGNGGAAGEGSGATAACDECVANAKLASGSSAACMYGCEIGTGELSTAAEVATCNDILNCVRESGCDSTGNPVDQPGTACYCGSVLGTTCFGALTYDATKLPAGVCASRIAAALEPMAAPIEVGMYYNDTTSPIGAAIGRSLCELNFCAKECGLATGAAGASGN